MKSGSTYAKLIKYLDRGKLHFGNLQMPITVIIGLGVYRDTELGKWIFAYAWITIPLIIIGFLAMLVLVGHLEYKYGLIRRQFEIDNENNAAMQELLKRKAM